MHALNPDASLWSSLAIAIEAGVLMGTAFVWRRNLWFVIGMHFAWNTTEMLLGIPVSGHREPGLIMTTVHGHPWLTGGDFGVEASVVPVILGVVLTVAMIARSRRSYVSFRGAGAHRKGHARGRASEPLRRIVAPWPPRCFRSTCLR